MYNVLIVDDEELIIEGMKVLIDWEQHGFRVLDSAGDGKTALQKMREKRFHLMVTDIRMPEMDGLRLIEQIREGGIRSKIVILSGYGEFEYAKKAIQYGVTRYLLKPVEVEELVDCLNTLKSELDEEYAQIFDERQTRNMARDGLLFDFCCGNVSETDLRKQGDKFGIHFHGQLVQIALVEISRFHQMIRLNMYDANLYKYGLRNIIEETVQQKGCAYVYEESDGMIGVIFHEESVSREMRNELLMSIYEAAQKWLKLDIEIGVGEAVPAGLVKTSRKQAQYALEQKPKHRVSIYHYYQTRAPDDRVWDMHWDGDVLIQALEEGDFRKLDESVPGFIREMEQKSLPKSVVQGMIFSLFYKIGRLIKKYEDDPTPFLAELQREFHLCFASDEVPFQQWFQEAMRQTGHHIAQLAKRKEPHIIHEVLEFIDAHYKDDLSLKQIAGLFFMNSAYLGQLFKQKTGESFNDTLNKCRISYVKKLLVQLQYLGTESIMEAGFKSVEHFYRQFKRYEGIPFSEYKRAFTLEGDASKNK